MAELHVWMNGMAVAVWAALRSGTPVFRHHEAADGTAVRRAVSVWPVIGNGPNQLPYRRAKLAMAMAMAVRGNHPHYWLREVETRHWQGLAAACGPGVGTRTTAMVDGVDGALRTVEGRLPGGFLKVFGMRLQTGCGGTPGSSFGLWSPASHRFFNQFPCPREDVAALNRFTLPAASA